MTDAERRVATTAAPFHFETVHDAHRPLVWEWLNQPHWQRWWGEPNTEMAEIFEPTDTSWHGFIARLDDVPIGFIQHWRVGTAIDDGYLEEAPWLSWFPRETRGIDLSIGPEELLGKGYGSRMLTQFVADVVEPLSPPQIIIDPEVGNDRAIAAYRKAGFTQLDRSDNPCGDTLLMTYIAR